MMPDARCQTPEAAECNSNGACCLHRIAKNNENAAARQTDRESEARRPNRCSYSHMVLCCRVLSSLVRPVQSCTLQSYRRSADAAAGGPPKQGKAQ